MSNETTVLGITFVLQCLVAQYGGFFFRCYVGGMTGGQWAFCVLSALSVLAWQQFVNFIAYIFGEIDAPSPYAPGEAGMFKFKSCFGNGNVTYAPPVLKTQKSKSFGPGSLSRANSRTVVSPGSTPGGRNKTP